MNYLAVRSEQQLILVVGWIWFYHCYWTECIN